MKKIFLAVMAVMAIVCSSMLNASATDRVQWLFSMNPPSQWLDFNERQNRIGQGALIQALMGGTNGFYYNLVTSAAGGLNVTVAPISNTVGAVYQFLPEEVTPFGGYPSGVGSSVLPADPTQVFLQGSLAPSAYPSETSPIVGPLSPPSTAGWSIDYVVECQVSIQDVTPQTITLVSSSGVGTQASANRDRVDGIACQSKAGTAAPTGTQIPPTTDFGWVCVSFVAVANGTTTINSGMITAYQPYLGMAPQVAYGYVPLSPGGLMTGLTATTTGSCTTGSVCSLSAGGTVTLSSTGTLSTACHGTVQTNSVIQVIPYHATTSSVAVAFYNLSGSTITTGTTITYNLTCSGG